VRIITIQKRPYTVINGKDFAVYRWFEPDRHGPIFIQVAGRTSLSREDLPTDDWIVVPGRAGTHRLATAWRKRWLAYSSDESGNPEIFVRPFPTLDRKWKISQGGALQPHWRSDGRELLFVGLADRAVAAVDVLPSRDGLEVGIPRGLFAPGSQLLGLAPAADHSRFLAGIIPGDVRTEPIRVLLSGRRAAGSGSKP